MSACRYTNGPIVGASRRRPQGDRRAEAPGGALRAQAKADGERHRLPAAVDAKRVGVIEVGAEGGCADAVWVVALGATWRSCRSEAAARVAARAVRQDHVLVGRMSRS